MEQNGPKPVVAYENDSSHSSVSQFEIYPEPSFQTFSEPEQISRIDYLQSTYLIDKSPASYQRHEGLSLLRDQVINGVEKPYSTNKNRFIEWDNQRCLKYGSFLVNLVSPDILNHQYITHAARAGIGPGVGGIERRFGSLALFYKELGIAKDNPRNHFDDWTIGNYLEYIQGIARMNNGEISESIIRRHYNAAKNAGTNLPSPSVIKKATGANIGLLIEMAGFKVSTRPKGADACALAAVEFYASNGRWPNARDLQPENGMPSWPTVRKYCGSMSSLISMAKQTQDQIMVENQELLAA